LIVTNVTRFAAGKTPPETKTLTSLPDHLELEGFAAEGYFASLKCVCPGMFGMNWDGKYGELTNFRHL